MGFKLGRALGKVAGGLIRSATRGVIRPTFQRPSRRTSVLPITPGARALVGGTSQLVGPGISGIPSQLEPEFDGTQLPAQAQGFACPTGFRLNRSKYITRGGGTSRWPMDLIVHEKGSTCVRRRKLNAGNGRAATRAVRRLVAFYRLSNRVAKQLRRAASKARIGRAGRTVRRLPAASGQQIISVD